MYRRPLHFSKPTSFRKSARSAQANQVKLMRSCQPRPHLFCSRKKSPVSTRVRDISEIMRRIKSANTEPERVLRKALRAKGLRLRTCPPRPEGKPDIVFPRDRLAIFVDGDFWHGNQWRKRGLRGLEDQFRQTKGKDYWLKKIRRNMCRDCAVTAKLLDEGWTVIRFWESEIKWF